MKADWVIVYTKACDMKNNVQHITKRRRDRCVCVLFGGLLGGILLRRSLFSGDFFFADAVAEARSSLFDSLSGVIYKKAIEKSDLKKMGGVCFKSADVCQDTKQLPLRRSKELRHRDVYKQFDHHMEDSDSSDKENTSWQMSQNDTFPDDSSSSSSSSQYEEMLH